MGIWNTNWRCCNAGTDGSATSTLASAAPSGVQLRTRKRVVLAASQIYTPRRQGLVSSADTTGTARRSRRSLLFSTAAGHQSQEATAWSDAERSLFLLDDDESRPSVPPSTSRPFVSRTLSIGESNDDLPSRLLDVSTLATVKGKTAPDALELDFTDIPFVGRDQEMKILNDAYMATTVAVGDLVSTNTPTAQFIYIHGEHGTGKTTLIDTFVHMLLQKHPDCWLVRTTCTQQTNSKSSFPQGLDPAMLALIDCVEQLIVKIGVMNQGPSYQGDENWSTALRQDRDFICSLSSWAPYSDMINQFLSGNNARDMRAHVEVEDMDDSHNATALLQSFACILRIVALRIPILLILEDIPNDKNTKNDRMDACWFDCQQQVIKQCLSSRLMWVVTSRSTKARTRIGKQNYSEQDVTAFARGIVAYKAEQHVPLDEIIMEIALQSLSVEDCTKIIAHLLGRSLPRVELRAIHALACLIHRQTGGNPLSGIKFIRQLREKELIWFSLESFQWSWDLETILTRTTISDNVLKDRLIEALALPQDVRQVLLGASTILSCSFTTEILINAIESLESCHTTDSSENLSVERIHKSLYAAERDGFVDKLKSGKFRFCHRQVREQLYELIPKDINLKRVHLNIGRAMLHSLPELDINSKNDILMIAAKQCNKGVEYVSDESEKWELVRVNQLAAQVALKNSAFSDVVDFLQTGLSLLGDDRWRSQYETTINMASLLVYARYCSGNPAACKTYATEVIANAHCARDSLLAWRILILCLAQQNQFNSAEAAARDVLQQTGLPLPKRLLKFWTARKRFQTNQLLRRFHDEDLLVLSSANNPLITVRIEFLYLLAELGIMSGKSSSISLVLLHMAEMAVKSGRSRSSSLAFAALGSCFASRREFERARRYGNIALELAEEMLSPSHDARAIIAATFYVSHLFVPYYQCLEPCVRGLKLMEAQGNIEHLYSGIYSYFILYFCAGMDLRPLEQDALQLLRILEGCGQEYYFSICQSCAQLVLNLRGRALDPLVLTGDAMNQADCQTRWTRYGNQAATRGLLQARMILGYIFGDLTMAEAMSQKLLLENITTPLVATQLMFQGLIYFALAKERKDRGKLFMYKGTLFLRKIKEFVSKGDVNCKNMLLLLLAEQRSLTALTKREDVREAYDKAIKHAARMGCMHNQAIANERAARFFLDIDEEWAKIYMTRAWQLYQKWGASAKASQLIDCYAHIIDRSQLNRCSAEHS